MQTSYVGIALIKRFEDFRSAPYKDSGGTWTQGWGHTTGVTADSPTIDEDKAVEWLLEDLAHVEGWIEKYITAPLTQNQFDALASLCFNEGYAPLIGTLGHCINDQDFPGAAIQFTRWVFVGSDKVAGLIARRSAEQALFSR